VPADEQKRASFATHVPDDRRARALIPMSNDTTTHRSLRRVLVPALVSVAWLTLVVLLDDQLIRLGIAISSFLLGWLLATLRERSWLFGPAKRSPGATGASLRQRERA